MSYNYCTNDEIVPLAQRGVRAETATGNMSTDPGHTYYWGYLPYKLREAFQQMRGRISQTIYSYSTPIALCIDGVWIIPDVTYSATTSSKHQSQLWQLDGVRVPCDAPLEEIERVIAGKMIYTGKGYRPGRNYIPGE